MMPGWRENPDELKAINIGIMPQAPGSTSQGHHLQIAGERAALTWLLWEWGAQL
jgi:hypothetical protein